MSEKCVSTVKKIISTIKLNLVDNMKRITYLCVILHVEHKKLRIFAAFTRLLFG